MMSEKRVLFIGPRFFGYENEIIKTLEQFGATVDYYEAAPDQRSFCVAGIGKNGLGAAQSSIDVNKMLRFSCDLLNGLTEARSVLKKRRTYVVLARLRPNLIFPCI